jgi:hypothetical protein
MIFLLLKGGSESDVSYGVNLNLKGRESGSDASYDASHAYVESESESEKYHYVYNVFV